MYTWPDVSGDAFNEEVSRILLGEGGRGPATAAARPANGEELLEQTRALVEELRYLTKILSWGGGAGAAPADTTARRIREIAATLTDLFEP
jgi:hypothetical protein